jgi:selenocysteine lyase/cysteine desulfurase
MMTVTLDRPCPTALTQPTLPAVTGADLRVPLVTGETTRYANLDYAASAPALREVAEHVQRVLPYYASVHRGAGYASQVCTGLLERARETVGEFVGARESDVVIFTRNTTDALNLLAGCVPGAVLCLDIEHHANLLPWRAGAHRALRAAGTVERTLEDLAAALAATPTALLAITGASNVTGEVLPLDRVVAIAHAAGARVVLDAAQLAPHRRIDLAATGVDYLALSGHKLYAPYGAGALIGRRDWLDAGQPHLAGGGAVRAVTPTATVWAAAPHRHEGGTPNVLGGPAAEHERVLLDRLETGLAALPGVEVLRIWPDSPDRIAVLSFVVADRPAGYVAAYLSAEHGIGLRDGKFCAHPLLQRLCRGGEALRASIGLGTTAEDIDRLLAALRALLSRGASWTYAPVDGRWTPTPDTRELDPLGVGVPGGTGAGCGTTD